MLTASLGAALAAALAFASTTTLALPLTVSPETDATLLVNAITGPGFTVVGGTPTLETDTGGTPAPDSGLTGGAGTGFFYNAASVIGINSGILLTTGSIACAPGPNTVEYCSGPGTFSRLKFDFSTDSGKVFFNFVFASEEYNEFVGADFNDQFSIIIDGVNIALIPNSTDPVAINSINQGMNVQYFRTNSFTADPFSDPIIPGPYDIQYDGFTTALTAFATVGAGVHSMELFVTDVGDEYYDSAIFLQAGSFAATQQPIPVPGTMWILGLGLGGLAAFRRRRRS